MSEWKQGDKERRSNSMFSQEFYDKMMETHNDVKHMRVWSETHDKDDETRFEKLEKNDNWQNKLLYGAIGIFVFVEFMSKIIK